MEQAFYTLCSMFLATLLFVILAGLKEGFVEAQSGHLPLEEVIALVEIGNQLGKIKNWNFSVNPCDKNDPNVSNWTTTTNKDMPQYNNSVICNCSYPGGICHIESMFLKGQDLDGVLPPSLAKLPYIKQIDFTRNYLHGTIPTDWTSTKLEYLSVTVNCLSGPIPDYLGNMSTLIYLNLEHNRFNGSVPAELGKLVNLQNLIINANYLTGRLPQELNKLINLQDIRLSSNNFNGKLPDFRSWKQLQKLYISNLNGGASEFPRLENMTKLKYLMLRSCNISGEVPTYLSQLSKLQKLDLSFNNLAGEIHSDLRGLDQLEAV